LDRGRIGKLLRQGWNDAEIARRLKISLSSVYKIKHPNYSELYMIELRKHVRQAVSAYFRGEKLKGYKLYERAERKRLKGKPEEELLSILENVGGDIEVVLQKVRQEVSWAAEAAYDAAFGQRERVESESRSKGDLMDFEQDEVQKRLLERPKARQEKYMNWKT
jgi:hypothetical protein